MFDTGIWLDLLSKDRLAAKARRVLLDRRHEVVVSAVCLAEVARVGFRRGLRDRIPAALDELRRLVSIVEVDSETFERAGWVHGKERAHHAHFSLADAILLTQARDLGARLLTTDRKLAKNHQGVKATVA